ncbi:1501_t:CDS:2 [Dentiscutata erythropus]|uniref:1501_t:CDS:1 n=1 Tax=Dentiscutata erythropus TaxID=1348616 RepID=A0A9N8WI35_9GLOM|nr:1501_t:CDS:2 [Dentiscutata erythropus]
MNMKSIISYLLVLLVIFNVVNAHFQLQAPKPRGFEDAKEPTAPCGGFDSVGNITDFPISQGQATCYFEDGDGTLTFYYAPTQNSTFIQIISVNLTRANATIGSQGVLQAVFALTPASGNGSWYQCADIKVTGDTKTNSAANVSPHISAITLFIGFIFVFYFL